MPRSKKSNAKLQQELALAVQYLGHVPLRSNLPGKKEEDQLRQRIDKARKSDAITEEQYRALIPAVSQDDAKAKKHSKLLCEKLWQEVQELSCVPFRCSKDVWRRQEDNLRQRIQHAKEAVPFFVVDWSITVFDGLMEEMEQLRMRRELVSQFDECYKTGSITQQQYRSLIRELETSLEPLQYSVK